MFTSAFAADCDDELELVAGDPFIRVMAGTTVALILPTRAKVIVKFDRSRMIIPFRGDFAGGERWLTLASHAPPKIFARYKVPMKPEFSVSAGHIDIDTFSLFEIDGIIGRMGRTPATLELIWLARMELPILFMKNDMAYAVILSREKREIIHRFAE